MTADYEDWKRDKLARMDPEPKVYFPHGCNFCCVTRQRVRLAHEYRYAPFSEAPFTVEYLWSDLSWRDYVAVGATSAYYPDKETAERAICAVNDLLTECIACGKSGKAKCKCCGQDVVCGKCSGRGYHERLAYNA